MTTLLLISFGMANPSFIAENVVFQETGELATTRSSWTVSFVIETKPYEQLVTGFSRDVEEACRNAHQIVSHYKAPRHRGFLNSVVGLQKELEALRKMRDRIFEILGDYRTLRAKRSLLPFLGKAFSFLFGTVDEGQSVRQTVDQLQKNQVSLVHVVEDSLSVLNTSRVHIMENRHAINEILDSLGNLNARLANITGWLATQVAELQHFTQVYLQLDLIVEELRQAAEQSRFALEHFASQIDLLSLGHLGPTLITPRNLRRLLGDISARLPGDLGFVEDPNANLWYFYRTLTCSTIIERDRLIVMTTIPLIDPRSLFTVYKIYNLPVPYVDPKAGTKLDLVAYQKLEASALAISPDRSKYLLLSDEEATVYVVPKSQVCRTRSPVYPTNLSKICVIALFTRQAQKVLEYCIPVIRRNNLLPVGVYIRDGTWAVASRQPLTFSIVCKDSPPKIVQIPPPPPISFIRVADGCSATNDFLVLPAYTEKKSKFQNRDTVLQGVGRAPLGNITPWKPLIGAIPDLDPISLPPKLSAIEEIPMRQLINELRSVQAVQPGGGSLNWLSYGIPSAVAGLLLAIVSALIVRRCRTKLAMVMGNVTKEVAPVQAVCCTRPGEGNAGGTVDPSLPEVDGVSAPLMYPRLKFINE